MSLTISHPDPRMQEPYALSAQQLQQFREDGFIKLKNVLSPEILKEYGDEITRLTLALNPLKDKPLEGRDTYGKAFIQVGALYEQSEQVRKLSFSRRLAKMAAELLDVKGVRIFQDQSLYKEAGGGFTPWHVDQQYWPMATAKTVTAWIPLHAVPKENGPLCFGKGSHRKNIGRDLPISDESERLIREAVKQEGVVEVFEPYELGEISFHHGYTLHRAGPNTCGYPRKVYCIMYMDQDTRLKIGNEIQGVNAKGSAPGIAEGEIIASPRNPVLYAVN